MDDSRSIKRRALRDFTATDADAKKVFTALAGRSRRRRELTVEAVVRDADIMRANAIHFLQKLAELGCGTFYQARGKKAARFVWAYTMMSVAMFALGRGEELEPQPEAGAVAAEGNDGPKAAEEIRSPVFAAASQDREPSGNGVSSITIALRDDFTVHVQLPPKLTQAEAKWISGTIQSMVEPAAG